MKLIILFILLLIYIYSNHRKQLKFIQGERFTTERSSKRIGPFKKNKRIVQILESMHYISDYNDSLYKELISTVNIILTTYYRFINDDIDINDISFHKDKLSYVYEEITLNLPHKYYDRLSKHIEQLNHELDKKMDLIKIKSSKIPIKISLMNYKSQ